jgi:IS4 transposase
MVITSIWSLIIKRFLKLYMPILAENQLLMAKEGAIEMLIHLLSNNYELVQRQAAKALANLGVNAENKRKIAECGGK